LKWVVVAVTLVGCGVLVYLSHERGRHRPSSMSIANRDIVAISLALDEFETDCGRYPTAKEGLGPLYAAPPDVAGLWHGPYLQPGSVLIDPWRNPYILRPSPNPTVAPYRVVCLGPDGKEGTADDITAP
jgi:general secretion pathway protein G